jgi:hypothetical protein
MASVEVQLSTYLVNAPPASHERFLTKPLYPAKINLDFHSRDFSKIALFKRSRYLSNQRFLLSFQIEPLFF